MAKSIAQQIVEAIIARVEEIRLRNGYSTDAGRSVFWSRQAPDSGDLPCSVVWAEAPVMVERYIGGRRARYTRLVTVEAMAEGEAETSGVLADQLLADLQTAILGPVDETIGGLVAALHLESADVGPRDDGGLIAGASLGVRVEYFAGFGNPYGLE